MNEGSGGALVRGPSGVAAASPEGVVAKEATGPSVSAAGALAVARPLGLTRYGPEQVDFLRYRPVLDNARLKREFGYVPALTSREAFDRWRERGRADTGR